ncbi:uncharacterized protein LODBEIA_P59670 [Lodderomyces beijingensis]|uniref:Inheritance of peroxisomes protein 1 n=1 Tax=Lodderomyces beijingensis TaxID=1775926 RepID=A0ABP0ZUC8_9ASCO
MGAKIVTNEDDRHTSQSHASRSNEAPSGSASNQNEAKQRKRRIRHKNKAQGSSKKKSADSNPDAAQRLECQQQQPQPTGITTQQEHEHEHEHDFDQPIAPAHLEPANRAYTSPRKEAILRYKSSDLEPTPDLREHLKPRNENSPETQLKVQGPSYINMEGKVTLFKFESSKILELASQNKETGSLLAHGEFEIFQLHNGDVTYLSCGGKSFIYPLLPKIRILRISFNHFLLPLLNPERYWKIFIHSDAESILDVLEGTFKWNVQYLNISSEKTDEKSPQEKLSPGLGVFADERINARPHELSSPNDFPDVIDTTIPDSPPSAPISPTQIHSVPQLALSPSHQRRYAFEQNQIKKQASLQSLSTNVACLDLNAQPSPHQVKPRRYENPYETPTSFVRTLHEQPAAVAARTSQNFHVPITRIDEKSESSMDSLLDEFEQNVQSAKPASTVYHSRPVSRQQSVASIHHQVPTYSRGKYFHAQIDKDDDDGEIRHFPSLSEYNRNSCVGNNNNGHASRPVMSRRSSRSDLYADESGWMEPNLDQNTHHHPLSRTNTSRLPKSVSNYSINTSVSTSYNLGSIYKSVIGQRNERYAQSLRNGHHHDDTRASVKSMSRIPSAQQVPRRQSIYMRADRSTMSMNGSAPVNHRDKDVKRDVKLDSREIYRLLSEKSTTSSNVKTESTQHRNHSPASSHHHAPPPRSASFASRFFGW